MKARRDQVVGELMANIAAKNRIADYRYDVTTGLNKKEGFVSTMYHVKLTGTDETANDCNGTKKTLNLLIKFAPTNESFRNTIPLKEAYRREIVFYASVVPMMEEALKAAGLKPRLDYVVEYYDSTMEEYQEAIVLANLKHSDYELWDCKRPMNDAHVRYVLRRYGEYHANGFALKHLRPEAFAATFGAYKKNLMLSAESREFREFLVKQMGDIAKGITAPEDGDMLAAFLRHKENVIETMRCDDDSDEYFTLLHGDCWCNNMMFKYDDESKECPSSMKFLDWQIMWFGPPVNDIAYFFYANASVDMYDRIGDYLSVYHESFADQLKAFGLDATRLFPRDALDRQMKKHARYGMSLSFLIMHVKLFKDEMKDHEDTCGTDESIFDQFRLTDRDTTEYFKMSNALIRHCYTMGYI